MTRTVSNPSPPSMPTGAFIAYRIVSAPASPFMSVRPRSLSVEPARAKARTVKRSSPSPPLRFSGAMLWNTVNSSLPSPPFTVVATLTPAESQPRVISMVANTSSAPMLVMTGGMTPGGLFSMRSERNTWPICTRSLPVPRLMVVAAITSSETTRSLPPTVLTVRPSMLR